MIVTIYGKTDCLYCTKAKQLAEMNNCEVEYLLFGKDFTAKTMLEKFPNARTFPQIVVNGESIGGYLELESILNET